MKTRGQAFADTAPPLRDAERDKLNALFRPFIFRRSRTGEIWTTCCHRHATVTTADLLTESFSSVMAAEHQREAQRWESAPAPMVTCPFCGTPVIVKELRFTGKRDNLADYRRAVILRWYRGALWARAYDCAKRYGPGHELTGYPDCKLVGVFRFRPGLAEGTSRSWYGDAPFYSLQVQDGPLTKCHWKVRNPFSWNAEYGTSFDVIGMEEIQKSPFRYCMADRYVDRCGNDRLVEFLTACCFYPRQIEMLMKAKMQSVVFDLVDRGVKHAAVIDWSREKPTDSFGLTKQELDDFLATDRKVETLELYRRLKRKASMAEAAGWVDAGLDVRKTFRLAKKWNIVPERLVRYLFGQVGKSGMHHISFAIQAWTDYLTAAEDLGYALHRDNVLMPRSLDQAHEEATGRHREKLRREAQERQRLQELEQKERMAAEQEAYVVRRKELDEKYGFALDGYLIRAPISGDEILDEGRALKHCVAGYAERHVRGAVTILFMRTEKRPDEPWLTIEMDGNRLKQIHGFKNEGLYTEKGRFAPDPREVYREFLDTWLDWLAHGSKRDEQGKPKLPRRREKVTAA